MWIDDELKTQMQTSYMLSSKARILAEINLNTVVETESIGVYQYAETEVPSNIYHVALKDEYFIAEDLRESPSSLIDKETPLLDQYFSLKDCFTYRRPRAGIVYPLYFAAPTKTYIENHTTAYRPRNYIVGKNMLFKYWTSLKMAEEVIENISSATFSTTLNGYPISNSCPAIIFKNEEACNKVVIKIQTHSGQQKFENDPITTKKVPADWEVQYLTKDNQWLPAYKFPVDHVIPNDGNIELMWGPTPPLGYEDTFRLYGSLEFEWEAYDVPLDKLHVGMAYIYETEGKLLVWDGQGWIKQELVYGWVDATGNPFQYTVDAIVDPDKRQFIMVKGMRVFVRSMTEPQIPFDLIELSPRLQLDITPYVDTYDIDKSLGLETDLPLSDLSNDIGSLMLVNYDLAFSKLNPYDGETGSIIANYMSDHTKILIYTAIKVDEHIYKYIPVKTMYVEYWPIADPGSGDMTVNIQDYSMFLETLPSPELFLTESSLTYILATVLDNSGISNYSFMGFSAINDVVIPYFFCNSTQQLADVLSGIIHAARCAIYFDEYNNLIIASKEYLSGIDRSIDTTLNGSRTTDGDLTDIESITIDKRVIFNDGSIVYSPKFIVKQPMNADLSFRVGKDVRYQYTPTDLWTLGEKSNESEYLSVNKNVGEFSLSSVLLYDDLPAVIPTYDPGKKTFQNNTFNIGASAWYLNRFSGYLYANGEIIRYDAVEYRISGIGDVWVSGAQQYNSYVNDLPWNGWIDVTGRVRIWTELENEKLIKHGRGYFKTPITTHETTADPFWLNAANIYSMQMESKALFSVCEATSFVDWNIARDGSDRWVGEGKPGTKSAAPTLKFITSLTNQQKLNNIKASALNWKGPQQSIDQNNKTINYFRKPFEPGFNYQRFGTRMRIVGEPVTVDNKQEQQPDGSFKFFESDAASGGLALFTDSNRQGYFLEAIAYRKDSDAVETTCPNGFDAARDNLIFYKVMSVKLEDGTVVSMPFKLWSATIPIVLDKGMYALEDRALADTSSVFDLEVECYKNEFDIYFNGKKLGTAIDDINSMIVQNAKYFDESTNDQYEGDDNANIIKSVPQYNKNSQYWGVFIRGDSRVLFENVWAAVKTGESAQAISNTDSLEIFGEVELDNNFGTQQIDSIYRRHSLSGFIQKGLLANYANQGYQWHIYYEEFGTILRECYLVDARYTEAYPTFYARLIPPLNLAHPFVISQEQLGPFGAEFVIFNVADSGIVLDDRSRVKIRGIVMSKESEAQITVNEFLKSSHESEKYEMLTDTVMKSRRKNGTKEFTTINPGPYIQTMDIAKEILTWAIAYFTTEKLKCTANIFANPMIQLADIIEFKGLAGKNIKDGTTMIVESISYSHDSTGPQMSVGLREVL